MRIDHFRPGESQPSAEHPAPGSSSFGRIARRRPVTTDSLPPSMQLQAAARTRRAQVVGDLVASAIRALGACVRELAAAWWRQGDVRAVNEPRGLDTRTLQDLAIPRSEILSVALDECAVEAARLRTTPANHRLRLS